MKRPYALLLCLLCGHASAEMYRWVDKNGVVQYTQTPPPGMRADKVKPAPPPDANPGMDAVRALNQNAAKAREEKTKNDADAAKTKAGRDDLCQRARERVSLMETRGPNRLTAKNEDGSMRRMTPDEHGKHLDEARAVAKKNC